MKTDMGVKMVIPLYKKQGKGSVKVVNLKKGE
jgi:hypothetical protein